MAEENQDRSRRPGRTLGRLVGSVVSPIVDGLDVDEIIDQVDVDDVVSRIDINEVVSRIDVDEVVSRIDVDEVVDRVDIGRLLARVDLDGVLAGVDVDRVLGRIDPDALLDHVDPDALLDRVDPNRLLDRVDPNRLLDRVDPNALLDRVDANRLLERVDVNELVARTELGEIITRSTSGVFTQLLDAVRTQIIVADDVVQGIPARVLRRARREVPPRPGGVAEELDSQQMSFTERAVEMQGRFAGSLSRFLAFLVDQFVIGVVFAVGALLIQSAVQIVFRSSVSVDDGGPVVVAAYMLWWFLYMAGSLAATGRTIGSTMLGLMVVRADGTRIDARRSALRTLVFPLNFLLVGAGFVIGLVRRDRCELHDLIADAGVIYAWDADAARLRADVVGIGPPSTRSPSKPE
jgi:uncharacterized RDD family membrane protein YckC